MIFRSILISLLISFFFALNLNANSYSGKILSFEEVVSQYTTGFNLIKEKVNSIKLIDKNEEMLNVLKTIIKFRDNYITWARINNHNYVLPTNPETTALAFFAVGTTENPYLKSTGQTVIVEPESRVLIIRPVPVASMFAGLRVIHESSHLYDLVTGIEAPDANDYEYLLGEVRAFMLESFTCNLYSDGTFKEALNNLELELIPRSMENVAIEVKNDTDSDLAKLIYNRIENALKINPPLSMNDYGMRLGFYSISLALNSINKQNITPSEKIGKMVTFMGKVYKKFL